MAQCNLPSPWFRIKGACVKRGSTGKLSVYLPAWLVPSRRFCGFTLTPSGLHIHHSYEEFETAKPGKNAWQKACRGKHPAMDHFNEKFTQVDRRFGQLMGSPNLPVSVVFPNHITHADVRVTREGFELRRRRKSCPEPSEADQDNILHSIYASPNHQPINNPQHQLITNCRCIITKEEEDMTKKRTPEMLPAELVADQSIVSCEFVDGQSQTYGYFNAGLDLKEGDYAVVASPYGSDACYDEESGGYLKVVRVISVNETVEAIERASKWLIDKVDITSYREREANLKKMQILVAKIKKAEAAARAKLEMAKLAELSPELATLTAELAALTGGSTTE